MGKPGGVAALDLCSQPGFALSHASPILGHLGALGIAIIGVVPTIIANEGGQTNDRFAARSPNRPESDLGPRYQA